MLTFQKILRELSYFWEKQGCIIHQGYDLEVGAGTFNPATFLRCLGPEPYKAAYIEPCRRPSDGRYGTNPNRLQHYFQYQVILKPSPFNIQDLYLQSLETIGFDLKDYDLRFVHDDWESPTLGAWGLGWEVWMDGMEITQCTYFQCMGGINLKPVTGEITYGIERLAMFLQKVDSILDIRWNDELTYGDIYLRNEIEWSHYNFEKASTEMWFRHFEDYESEAKKLIAENFPIPAYDFVAKASHAFNLLDARGVISVSERTGYIAKIRELARLVAESYLKSREELHYPLMNYFKQEKPAPSTLDCTQMQKKSLLKPDRDVDDFVLEIGSEELPATFVPIGCANLEKSLRAVLEKENIPFKNLSSYGTPKRLTAYVEGLAFTKPEQTIEKRGPSIEQAFDSQGILKPAGEGFFRSIGKSITVTLDQIKKKQVPGLEIRSIKGIDYLFAHIKVSGRETAAILSEILPKLILEIDFPKKMRWADLDITYARPLQWILAIHGNCVIPFQVGNLLTGHTSQGHRLLSPGPIVIEKAQDYTHRLRERFVMVHNEERKASILAQLAELENQTQGQIVAREKVIPQVLNLVEWPLLTVADFSESFLQIPKEVLISEMVEHQKYFPIANRDGSLKNLFIITANTNPSEQLRKGNQKVLSARLSDGVFLYNQDLKEPLENLNDKLRHVTFLKGLGTVYDKVERLIAHLEVIHKYLSICPLDIAKRAALLCKVDLASKMVYEFPDLQGVIGTYYALAAGEDPKVAKAIDEHWMPRGENAPLPQSSVGILVSIADKMDNLLSCFSVDLKPTSSSDPYALRRQVLGIIKILIDGQYHLPLMHVFKECLTHFHKTLQAKEQQVLAELEAFIINRIKTVFQDYGFGKDEIEASVANGFTDVYDTFCKVKALHHFRRFNDKFPLLLEVYKRAKGQLNPYTAQTFLVELLKENAEKNLDNTLNQLQPQFKTALDRCDYDQAYQIIAQLQPSLAKLFDEVKILANEQDIRNNRIALLQRVFLLFENLLDFSKLQQE